MKKTKGVLVLGLAVLFVLALSSMVGASGYNWWCCDLGDEAEIVQYGVLNDATITQTGKLEKNHPWYPGFDPCLPMGCANVGNYADVFQMGHLNNASIVQN